jgi:glycosyltransferase involved in cell wall biosynthesis
MEATALRPRARVALVHDFLLDLRGAERVFLEMCRIWPQADVFTTVYDEKGTEGRFAERGVRTSFLQRLRPTARSFRALLPLYPAAIESFDFSGYDVVISSSSAWAHAIICDEQTAHICYCYNPFRYAWNDREHTLATRPDPLSRAALRALFRRWRQWDWFAAQRVDRYVAVSRTTQARIRAYFGRDAEVVHPPVETERFAPGDVGDYYLVLSELVSHKRIDRAVRAFNRLGRPLLIVGDGPDAGRLRRMAGPRVRFAGRVSDARVSELLPGCRALVQPSVEEFGIAAVEAQAAGRPVIAARGGGALETVQDGVTGCYWSGDADELARTVLDFDERGVDPAACVANAARFGVEVFRGTLPKLVEQMVAEARDEPRSERSTEYRRARQPRARGLGLTLAQSAPALGTADLSVQAEAGGRGA